MTTLQEYIGQIVIDGDSDNFTVDATPTSISTGTYFMNGYTGEGVQLCETLQVALAAVVGGTTVTRSTSTGLITIDFGASHSITWTDTGLRDILGYTGNLTGASSYVATNTPKGVWRPSRELVEYPGDLTEWWGRESSTQIVISRDGTTYTNEGNLTYGGTYGYEVLDESEVITDSSTVWESFEQFWSDVAHEGRPIRVLMDRTSYASTSDYVTGIMIPPDSDARDEAITLGPFSDFRNRLIESYNGFYNVRIGMAKYVT